jgi:hypothetical protein
VEDLDREVLPLGAEALLDLTLEDLAGPVMRVDHVVADLVLDRHDLAVLEVLDFLLPGCFGNDRPPCCDQVCR